MLKPRLDMLLSEPIGQSSALIQAIWSARVSQPEPVVRPLYADAGTGIIFNFFGEISLGDEMLPEGVVMLPAQDKAENIILVPGARLAGIRFHPAIGYGVLGRHYDRPALLRPETDQLYGLYEIYSQLRDCQDNGLIVEALSLWARKNLDITKVIPDNLEKALDHISEGERLGRLGENTNTSQRNIERHFKRWLGMTPKHYQRILRIKKALNFLREHQHANLADVAHQFGFSDQAHMTREFRAIARTTPGQI